ncbi:putative RND superfamily exporter [Desulfocapsa sulfexigens DSM 10523]|uniref:Putative RND superfamily exporter n=1 Tax=Desulfocapsa sulfexigens (strain DSM 10523 / SB164P1) TaxID=1167006 RepID=M1PLX5_DESSD|nr:MMPL family transporter [Desulfocapsa sulfexigens]AGF77451.1 putative RND superfamily exporter [Desulfocapsa sulfexigens DSM 10523]
MGFILKRCDSLFQQLSALVQRYRGGTLLFCATVTVILGAQLPNMRWDTSTEGYLSPSDPTITEYHKFQEIFGSDDLILIGIGTEDVFTVTFLEQLLLLHDELALGVPHLASIFSLANATAASRQGDQLFVTPLLQGFPKSIPDMEKLRSKVNDNPLLKNRLVSKKGDFATIILKIATKTETDPISLDQALAGFTEPDNSKQAAEASSLSNTQNDSVVTAVQKIVSTHHEKNFEVVVTGTPILKQVLRRSMTQDAALFIKLATLLIALLLWLIFRKFAGVLIPLLVVSSSVISTIGLMVLCGKAFKAPTIILPSFLMAMGVGASIHLMTMFYHNLRQGMDKASAINTTMGHSGMPVFLTSITTGVGLISFAGAEVAPVADLGLFAAIGVMIAFIYTILLVPSLLAFLPADQKRAGFSQSGYQRQNRILSAVASFSVTRSRLIIVCSGLFVALAVSGIPKIHFSHDPLAWLPENLPLRKATEKVQEALGGVISVEVLIDSRHKNGIYDPVFLKRLEQVEQRLENFSAAGIRVAQVSSVVDLLHDVHIALLSPDSQNTSLPEDRKLAAQELLLLENGIPAQLFEMIDGDYAIARLSIMSPWRDAVAYAPFLSELETEISTTMGESATVSVTGMIPLLARTLSAAMHSAARSYLLAGCIISLLTILMMGTLKLGLISLAPNILPIATILGVMGWTGIPLDIYTMLSGSIAIGLIVDDTIHFMYNFRRYQKRGMGTDQAVRSSLLTTGRAILITSVILASGAFICTLSEMNNLFNFGLLTGITILLAMAADFLLAPAILTVSYSPKIPSDGVEKPI